MGIVEERRRFPKSTFECLCGRLLARYGQAALQVQRGEKMSDQENSGIDAAKEVEVNKSEEDLRKEVYALENQVSYYKDRYDEVCKQLEETKKTRSRLGIPLRVLKWYLSGIKGPGSFQFWDRKRKRINWFNHKVSDLYVKMWRAKFIAEPIDNPWKDILGRW